MSNEYALDVAFKSTAIPVTSTNPIAMAYGFTEGPPGQSGWGMGQGQAPDKVQQNSGLHFSIFDTASPASTLTAIEISFSNNSSPFDWTTRSFPDEEPLPPSDNSATSSGCNLKNVTGWQVGPYTAQNEGDFQCNILVTVQMSDQTTKQFSVDPEIIVEGGG